MARPPLSFPVFPGMSAHDSLSLSTDGPIPSHLWAEAHACDLAHPLTCEIAQVRKVELKRSFGLRLLAFAMAQAITARNTVEARDLENLGLTPKQIAEWKQEALALVLSGNPSLAEFAFQEAA